MPSLPENDSSCNSHLAALIAINIVTEVLDEAEDILNEAHDSGQPWRYVWRQKKGNGEFIENAEIIGILDYKVEDNDINSCELIHNDNVIVTSTPQKEIDYNTKTYTDNSFIGQGDEDIQTRTDLQSPSMLINRLFDMSEVEQSGIIKVLDEEDVFPDSRDFLASTVAKLVESYVNLALSSVCANVPIPEQQVVAESIDGSSNSSYSLLNDANMRDNTKNATYYTETIKSEGGKDQCMTNMVTGEDVEEVTNKDIELYEKTFMTLNCDYDKYSEEGDFVRNDKSINMQEVELLENKSFERLASFSEPSHILTKQEERSKAVDGIHKRSLVKRCRLQGAKLISRLRSWWWKQRLIGRRKGCRSGICPLSPQARNRASSLLDNRRLQSPSPTRTTAWKFNTINEALIHSYNMMEYGSEINSSEPVKKE